MLGDMLGIGGGLMNASAQKQQCLQVQHQQSEIEQRQRSLGGLASAGQSAMWVGAEDWHKTKRPPQCTYCGSKAKAATSNCHSCGGSL